MPDFTSCGPPEFTHRKGARFSYLGGEDGYPYPVALGSVLPYNGGSKSKSFRMVAKAASNPLDPLVQNKAVTLLMDVPVFSPTRKRVAPPRPYPVVIVPGSLIGSSDELFLVAIVGKGAAVVAPRFSSQVSSLVMAGMPRRLASVLMDEFRRVLHRRN